MRLLLFILCVNYVTCIEVSEYIKQLECTIDEVDKIPDNLGPNGMPFIYKRGTEHLKELQTLLSIENLKIIAGNTEIGVDYPGSMAPKTPAWRKTTLNDYIDNHVLKLQNMSIYEALESNITRTYLWGPTDSNRLHDIEDDHNVKRHRTNFIPVDMYSKYKCPWKYKDIELSIFGLAGKYTGLPFHKHAWGSNEVVYGKKLWLLYPPEEKINTKNYTSIDMLFTMIEHYIDDESFYQPQMCIQNPGDVINIPGNWNHMTFNLETTLMVGCVYVQEIN